jgi:hypothetical protein
MIQRIDSPWTFQSSEASQGCECIDIPGENTVEDKMEMRNGLFRSLDPNARSSKDMEEEVEVLLPCRKGDYDLMGSGEIKCKKPKTWNVKPLGMPFRWTC